MQRTEPRAAASDEEEIAQALARVEAEVTGLQGRLEAWKHKDDEACAALTAELASANRQLEVSAAQRQATQERIDRMRRERRSLLSWGGLTWKGVQLAVRLLLALCAVIAFLMFATNDVLSGWPIFLVLVTDFAVIWFLGDLADYLELTHG